MSDKAEMGTIVVVSDSVNAPLFRSVGFTVYEARDKKDLLDTISYAMQREQNAKLLIVLKHLVEDEDKLRRQVDQYDVTLLILPTRWAKAEPINVDKLLAKALGLG
ncbi:MAG: hypothetical protein GSR73_06640 [Desulfurococcales archaeon]|nr:hypothetical protein [Desulfurococcales archaeon]